MGALALSLSGLTTCGKRQVELTRVSNGDTNGFIYYVGTNRLRETFSNPIPNRLTGIMSSSLSEAYPNLPGYDVEKMTDRLDILAAHTDSAPSSWIAIMLPPGKKIRVTEYSIKSRADSNSQHPLSWDLEASNSVLTSTVAGLDAAAWASIDSRTGQSWTGINQWQNFSANGFAANALRFRQTGANSSGENYFILGEIDFYGTYYY